MRIAGITLAVLIVITAILTLAVYNLDTIINKNKGYILSQIEKSAGRKAEIDNISLNILGGLGIQLTNFELSDDPDFSFEHFVKAPNLIVNVKFLPLLRKELSVKKIILNKPSINIIKNENGVYNFETIPESESDTKTDETDKKDGGPGFSIAFIDITDGEVFYKDKLNKTELTLNDIDMVTENIGFEKPVNIDLAFALLSEKQNISLNLTGGPIGKDMNFENIPLNGNINIDSLNTTKLKQRLPSIKDTLPEGLGLSGPLFADIEFNGNSSALNMENMEVRAGIFNSEQQNLRASGNIGPLDSQFSFDNAKLSVDFELGPLPMEQIKNLKPVAESFPDELNGTGPVKASGSVNGKIYSPELKSLKVDATQAELSYGEIFSKPGDMQFYINTDAHVSGNNITISNSELVLGTLVLNSRGTVRSGKNTNIDLSVNSNEAELGELHDVFLPIREYELSGKFKVNADVKGEYSDSKFPEINGTAQLDNVNVNLPQLEKPLQQINSEINFTGKTAKIKETSALMGQSKVLFSAIINSYSPLSVNYKVTSPAVYLSDITTGREGELKDLNIEGKMTSSNNTTTVNADITSKGGSISRVSYSDMSGNVNMKNEVINIENLDIRFLSGFMNAKGYYDMSRDVPEFNMNTSIQGLNITDVLKTLLSTKSEHIRGTGNLSLNLSGSGNNWDQISESLNGLGNLELKEGELIDFNLAEEVITGLTGIQGLSGLISSEIENKYPDIFKTTNTVFYNLDTPLKIVNGKINFNELLLKASDYIVKGDGWIGLNKKIEADGYLTLAEKLSADLASRIELVKYLNDEQGRVRIPFNIDGAVPGVKPSPDLSSVADTFRKAAVEKGKEQIRKKIFDDLKTGDDKTDSVEVESPDSGAEIKKKLKELIPFPRSSDTKEQQQEKSGDRTP